MNTTDNIVINTQGLTKTFKGVNALKSLNLTVRRNSIFGFLGPNGAGKTTTIKLLLGLNPDGGSATVLGRTSCATVSGFASASATWPRTRAITSI